MIYLSHTASGRHNWDEPPRPPTSPTSVPPTTLCLLLLGVNSHPLGRDEELTSQVTEDPIPSGSGWGTASQKIWAFQPQLA